MVRKSCSQIANALVIVSQLALANAAQADTKKIEVQTREPSPQEVRFDPGDDFDHDGTTYSGVVPTANGMTVRNIAVEFPGFDMPLRVIVNPRRNERIRFIVQAPSVTSCQKSNVNAVKDISGSVRQRIRRMIDARRLIDLCARVEPALPDLAISYYDLSCSLANDERTFFAIHRDAKTILQRTKMTKQRDKNRRAKLLKDCKGKGVSKQFNMAWTKIKSAGPGEATALIDELLQTAIDPELAEGFAASQIGIENIRRRKVWDLKRQQIDASGANELEKAISLTEEIEALRLQAGFAAPADLEGASEKTLKEERTWFNNRLDAQQRREAAEALDASVTDIGEAELMVPAELEAGAVEIDQ